MKKLTFLFAVTFISGLLTLINHASAQITLDQADLPSVGLTVVVDSDGTTKPSPGIANIVSPQVWNFSGLLRQKSKTDLFVAPTSTAYSGVFTTSNLADSTIGGNGYNFFNTSATNFSVVGAEEIETMDGYNFQIEINVNPPFEQSALPASITTNNTASGSAWGSQTFSTVILFISGERFSTTISYSDTVDAYGTLQMPNGYSYPVLRQRHFETDVDSVFLYYGSAWHFDETIVANKNQYDWYAKGVGFILAEMDMSVTWDTINDIMWDTTAPPPAVTSTPLVVAINSTNITCNGGSTGTATANVSGGVTPYTYLWEPGGLTASAISGLSAGTYTLSVTGNNDSIASEDVTITQPAILGVSTNATNVSCFGNSNGTATANASGGTSPYTYSWSSGLTGASLSGLSGGTYTITTTDNNGCTETVSAVITQPASALGISISSFTNVSSGAAGNITADTATGGTQPYTYTWTGGAGTNLTATNLSAGTYTITASDNNGCTASASATITQAANAVGISIASQTNVTCNGGITGNATANAATGGTSPYTYSWSSGLGTNLTVTSLSAGTYSITVTDSTGCNANALVVISQPSVLGATTNIVSNVSCNGNSNGSASVGTTGGTSPYLYSWSNGASGTSATGLSEGTYTVTVSDSCGATASTPVIITQPATLTLSGDSADVTGSCNGSAWIITVGGTMPYTYSWSTGGQTTDTITNQCVGDYCCVVTDANGCTGSVCINVDLFTGINQAGANSKGLRVYPNPNNGSFIMELSGTNGESSVEIYNILGQTILNEELLNKSNAINLSSATSGIYFYRVVNENGALLGEGKIVIEK